MRTNFTDAQDKRIVALALEYKSQHKRVEWKELARAMRSKHSVQALENRLRALKRTYGRDLSRFPPCFFSTSTPTFSHKQHLRPLEPSQAERIKRRLRRHFGFRRMSANAREIEKRPEVFLRGVHCLREHAPRLLLLHKVFLSQGDVLDTPLSSRLPFQRASIVFLNDFLFDELAKLAVQEQLYMMPRVRLIVSTSRYCPRHRDSCRRRFCSKWRLAKITYGRGSWKSPPIPIYMYTTVQ
ncbi:uncharacterized protein PITG_15327 [Phytophthora infestans T30-4]|uniref:Uncharacterized protein n=1 Tax=Phytophthora infestans (strain T30-4) TaxID=403677 RepID=D0NQF9_PHYIT|nr:uncharacterized protein PITG_15327 [Phytophthora infestans T30-4]EEY62891.1 conserved hypothetical protein [Phytophthora infestans T30-4]|eukprot:XP_002898766.1 conserved hypothetical protein [Phytophthora infestans T30-4]